MAEEQVPEAAEEVPEGAQTAPDELTQELQQREREGWEKLLDRVGEDPQFKQRFLDDPQSALQELGVEENLDTHAGVAAGEVAGQYHTTWWGPHRHYYGHRRVGRWRWHYHHYG